MVTYSALRWFLPTVLFFSSISITAQTASSEGPSSEKAQKTYSQAVEHAKKHQYQEALDGFKKADKQDDGHCIDCQKKIFSTALDVHDWKAAESASDQLISEAKDSRSLALGHYRAGVAALMQGNDKHKDEYFARAHEHFAKAIESAPNFPDAVFGDGKALAHLRQDDAAKARFVQFTKMASVPEIDRQRALRFIADPELARAKMAPPFSITAADGQQLSLDDLQGKVVLMDFWATWCGPCREAMPHMRDIAKKFKGEPLIVLSISLDDDEQKWKDFVQKNEMTWPQYRDPGGFKGEMAQMFSVSAIPHTFTIDADGVLQDEHIGDASVEGKLKKLIARAHEVQAASTAKSASQTGASPSN